MIAFLKSLDRFLLDIVLPQNGFCIGCGKLSLTDYLCDECRGKLRSCMISMPFCQRCGRPLLEESVSCSLCRHWDKSYPDLSRTVWRHSGIPKKLVTSLKYNKVQIAAEPLVGPMADLASRSFPISSKDTFVTSVTMPKKRLAQRGIDHGKILAQGVAASLGLPYVQLLERTVDRLRSQRGLTGEERRSNLSGTFSCYRNLKGRNILLVDDVTTTGSTAKECAATLKEAGAGQVWMITATAASNSLR